MLPLMVSIVSDKFALLRLEFYGNVGGPDTSVGVAQFRPMILYSTEHSLILDHTIHTVIGQKNLADFGELITQIC